MALQLVTRTYDDGCKHSNYYFSIFDNFQSPSEPIKSFAFLWRSSHLALYLSRLLRNWGIHFIVTGFASLRREKNQQRACRAEWFVKLLGLKYTSYESAENLKPFLPLQWVAFHKSKWRGYIICAIASFPKNLEFRRGAREGFWPQPITSLSLLQNLTFLRSNSKPFLIV